ncbi:hypothetical protein BKA62DRAFT_615740 [Auriculariales sp. MPI-PUGE-AT-0066]|nr:hypothetical protein BKA62DRAFT_615740 [Auriculariales sp. MPI-PUGE-AT-0066]
MPLGLPFLWPKRRVKDPSRHAEQPPASSARTLPPELLLRVLYYILEPNLRHLPPAPHRRALASVPLVCRSWHGPGCEALYRRVYLVTTNATKFFLRTLRRQPKYGALIQGICFCPPPPIAVILEDRVTKLSQWNISIIHPALHPVGTLPREVLQRCPKIAELCVETNVEPSSLDEFPVLSGYSAPGSAALQILSVRGDCNSTQPSSFAHLLMSLCHSSAFNIKDLTIHSYAFRGQFYPDKFLGDPRLPKLHRLRLTHCAISPEMFKVIAQTCAQSLRVLEIIDCQVLSRSASFVPLLASLTGLRKLSIGRGLPFGADMSGLTGLKLLSLDDYVCSHGHFIGAYPPSVDEIRVHIWWPPELGTRIAADYIRSVVCIDMRTGRKPLPHLKRVELRVYSRFSDLDRWRIMAFCIAGAFAPLAIRMRLMIVREEEEEDPIGSKLQSSSGSSTASKRTKSIFSARSWF